MNPEGMTDKFFNGEFNKAEAEAKLKNKSAEAEDKINVNKSVNRMDAKMGEGKKLNMGDAKVKVVPVTKRLTRQPQFNQAVLTHNRETATSPCAAAGEY